MNIEIFDINSDLVENPTIKYTDLTAFHRKLSHLLKTAKFNVLKVLTLKLKKMEFKIKNKEGDCKELSKLKHKQDEIDFLKSTNLDNIAKRVFANKYSESDLAKFGDKFSIEERIVARLFTVNSIASEINKFRSEHPDWERLAEDLLYKNTGGRIKINKSKKVCSVPVGNESVNVSNNKDSKKEESEEPLFLIPAIEAKKRKEILAQKRADISKRKEIEKQKKQIEDDNKVLNISEEAMVDYIKNADDLDEWEKDIVAGEDEDDGEIDMMAPLDGSDKVEKKKKKKRGGKKVRPNSESQRVTGNKWHGSTNKFAAKKMKFSSE